MGNVPDFLLLYQFFYSVEQFYCLWVECVDVFSISLEETIVVSFLS